MKTKSFAHAAVNDSQGELARIIEKMTQQLLDDPNVDLSPLIAQYPQHAEQLEYLLPAVQLMADVSRGGERAGPLHAHVDANEIADGTLGDFRLVREIGRGGMGVVYEAEQISLRRKVALKVLPFAALLDDRQIARFENEARAAATLYHAHIVPVFFVGTARGVHFYAMQLIEGCSLAEAIAELSVERPEKANADLVCRDAPVANPPGRAENAPRQQPSSDDPFPIPHSPFDTEVAAALSTQRATNPKQYFHRVAEMGIQVATALDHAHQHGIIHRDIKPANILIDGNGKPWITDFGLARIGSNTSMTMTGDVLGTLRYMSPEQARGDRTVDHRSDIYSLGITLYELATGRPAFTATNREHLILQVQQAPPLSPSRSAKTIPRNLETIILKAIAKEAHARYATAADFADDLSRFVKNRPIAARRQSRVSKARHWVRRNRTVAALSCVAVLLLMTLAITGPITAMRQRELAQQASEEAEHNKRLRYFADMRSAYEAWQRHDYRQAVSLLEDYKQSDLRRFEWYFLWNHLHLHEQLDSLHHEGTLWIFALSNDRRKLVASCLDDHFYVWDLVNHKLIASHFRPDRTPDSWVASIAVSNDGQTVLLGMGNGSIDVVSAPTGKRISTFDKHAIRCFSLALVPGDQCAVSGDSNGNLHLWDIVTGNIKQDFLGHEGTITDIRIVSDNRTFATSSGDRSIKLWSTDQIAPLRVMKGPAYRITTCDVASDGVAIFGAGGGGRSLWKWDIATGNGSPLLPRTHVNTDIFGIAYSSRLNLLAVNGREQGITILDADTGVPERDVISLPISETKQVKFAYDDITVVYANDREIKLVDLSYLEAKRQPQLEHKDWWTSLEYMPALERLIVCRAPNLQSTGQGRVVAWDFRRRRAEMVYREPNVAAWEVDASPIGDVYAVARGSHGDLSGKVTIHNAETGSLLKTFDDGDTSYVSVTFSPDGQLVAAGTGMDNGAVVIWEVSSGEVRRRFEVPTPLYFFKAVEFSHDGRQLIAGGGTWERGEVICWDIQSGKVVNELQDIGESVFEISTSPDRSEFALATHDGSTQVRDWSQLNRRLSWEFASDGFAVAYSPDGARLATGGRHRGVRLWDSMTGRQVASIPTDDRVTELLFIKDGRALAVGASGHAELWSENGTRVLLSD